MNEWTEGEDELVPQEWPTYHTEVPVWVLLSGVRAQAYKAYAFLAEHINNRRPGKRIACPKQAAIARVLDLKRPGQVAPYMNELAQVGAIRIEEYRYQGGMRRGYRYHVRFNPPPGYTGHLTLAQFYEANEDVRSAKAPGRTAASGARDDLKNGASGVHKNVHTGGTKNVHSHGPKNGASRGPKNVSPELDQVNLDQSLSSSGASVTDRPTVAEDVTGEREQQEGQDDRQPPASPSTQDTDPGPAPVVPVPRGAEPSAAAEADRPDGLLSQVQAVIDAYIAARPGVPVSAATRGKLAEGSRSLLVQGHAVDRVQALAADMAVKGNGRWTNLEQHAEQNPQLLAVPAARPPVREGMCPRHPQDFAAGQCPMCDKTTKAAAPDASRAAREIAEAARAERRARPVGSSV